MAITHVLSATTPDDPLYEIRPSHWNSAHAQILTLTGNTAGASTLSGTNIVFEGGPNVTLSANGDTLVFSGGAGGGGNTGFISAGAATASLGTVVFSNSNGLAFGVNGQTVTGSYTVPTQSNQSAGIYALGNTTGQSSSSTYDARTLSIEGAGIVSVGWSNSSVRISATQSNQAFSADASSTFQTLTFQNSNGVSFSNNAGALRVTHDLMFSSSRPAFSADASSTFQTLTLQNSNGISFSNNAGAVRITHDLAFSSQTNLTGRIYVTAQSTGQSSSSTYDLRTLSIIPDGIISAGWSNGSFRISATQSNQAFSADASSTFQTLTFQNSNGISFSNNAGAIRLTHDLAGTSTGFAGANISGSMTHNSAGLNLSLSVAAPGAAAENNNHNLLGANTAGNTTASGSTIGLSGINITLSGTNNSQIVISGNTPFSGGMSNLGSTAGTSGLVAQQLVFVGTRGLFLSQSVNGQSATLTFDDNQATISSYENQPGGMWNSSAGTLGMTSLSTCVAFNMPQAGSFSFMRVPILMTMASTTIATIASATASAQQGGTTTYNAVAYSLGTGASSKSLISVASGSGTVQFSGKISITNSTQGSYTWGYSALVEGGSTSRSTQYSVSNTNYSFTTQQMSEFSSNRFLDIPWANSLSPGAYWMVFGGSTSTSSAGAALTAITSWGPRYSNHYMQQQHNLTFGIMGSTNRTSGGLFGCGVFSTAGGGTTSGFDISAISSSATNARYYFQLLRSA